MEHERALKLPAKLAYTVVVAAACGALACSGDTRTPSPADASNEASPPAMPDADVLSEGGVDATAQDAPADGVVADGAPVDAPADYAAADAACDAQQYCGSDGTIDGAVCPGFVCELSECPNGCEPFV